jgi:uncharacterized protein YabE (DUF348 family)
MMKLEIKKHRLPLPILLCLAVVLTIGLSWATICWARQDVTVNIDGRVRHISTLQHNVSALLTEAGIKLRPEDQVSPALNTALHDGLQVKIHRAVEISVLADGKSVSLWTPARSVAGALIDARVQLADSDLVTPSLDSAVGQGTEIRVIRVTEKLVSENYSLPVQVERRDDQGLERGRSYVVRRGTAGVGKRTVKVTYYDGREVKRSTLLETVVKPAVSKIVAFGTMSAVSRGGQTVHFRQAVTLLATAYTAPAGKHTASGNLARYGVVATDPGVIPMGTRLYIDGYGYATALDVGGAIKGNRVDLYFPSLAQCQRWGERSVKAYILD